MLLASAAPEVNAQSKGAVEQCTIGRQAPATGFWTWAADTRVQVYIRSADFDAKQISSLRTALRNWSDTSELTGAGVEFKYSGNTDVERTCENCLTILRGQVFNKRTRHATEITAKSSGDTQIITSATVTVDPVLKNPEAILNAMVHELGHNLGLLDCFTCKPKSTVMNQFDALNVSNGMDRPSPCDLAQVKRAYEQLKVRVLASPTARNISAEDEGEEPVDDDTPVVMPNANTRPNAVSPTLKPVPRPE